MGLDRDILQKVSVSFTGEGSTGAPGTAKLVLNRRRGDGRGVAGDKPPLGRGAHAAVLSEIMGSKVG